MTERDKFRTLLVQLVEAADRTLGPAETNAVAMGVVMTRIRQDIGPAGLHDILRKIIEIDRAN